MSRLIFFLGTLLFVGCITQKEVNQLSQDKRLLYPIGENGKWGFADEDGTTVIPAIYDTVHFFSYGLALAKSNGKYGYLNKNGLWHIKPKYDAGSNFGFNAAKVSVNQDSFYINKKGRKARKIITKGIMGGNCISNLPARIEKYFVSENGFYELKYTYYFKEDSTSYRKITDTSSIKLDQVIEYGSDHFLIEKNGKFGFLFKWNKVLTREVFENSNLLEISQVIDKKILNELDLKYDDVTFTRKYESQVTFAKSKFKGKYGVLNNKGVEIFPCEYFSLKIYYNRTIALVEFEPGRYGFKNMNGKEYFSRTPKLK